MPRPSLVIPRTQLPGLLRQNPGARSSELAALAGVSTPTMVRMLNGLGTEVLRVGKTNHTRYYLRRPLRGLPTLLPVYAVNEEGIPSQVGRIDLIAPQGTVLDMAAMGWPVDAEFAQGVWPHGLPYPLQDMKPQGFLGRQFAHQTGPALQVSTSPKEWSDDDILFILMHKGTDTSGNLIVGDTALQSWLHDKARLQTVLTPETTASGYVDLAQTAASLGVPGSSAGGEFPKFTALRALADAHTPHVIVKFSGADSSTTVQRWADLLVCEHLALQAIRQIPGVRSAHSRILQSGGRTFLEVERFDRHGPFGRSPLCCLDTLEAAILQHTSTDWGDAGDHIAARGWLSAEAAAQLRSIWAFGKLIANADMHKGNMSFVPGPQMQLAPVYDMLPMAYAPLAGGEIPPTDYAPALPSPKDRAAWLQAGQPAQAFWESAAQDARISQGFRAICAANAQELERLMPLA